MNVRGRSVRLASGLLAAAVLAGCGPVYPEPSAEAVLRSIRNARLHGRLRVCWPEGQAYVEKVMKADAALRAALNAVAPVQTVDALWAREDPRWRAKFPPRPPGQADARADTPGPAGTAVAGALDSLAAAIKLTPDGLALDTLESHDAFVRDVWAALAVDGVPLRQHVAQAEALGDLLRRLETRVASCCASYALEAGGLTFSDEACQRDVDALYDELADALRRREDAFLRHAAERMQDVQTRLARIDKQKQRDEYLWLDNTREYFDNVLRDGWLKSLDDRIRAAERQLAAQRAQPSAADPAAAKFLEGELVRLKERHATLSQRVSAIMTPPTASQ